MWRFKHLLEEQSAPLNVGVCSSLQEKEHFSEALQKSRHVQERSYENAGRESTGGGVPGRKKNGQNNYIWSTEYLKQTNNFYSDVF